MACNRQGHDILNRFAATRLLIFECFRGASTGFASHKTTDSTGQSGGQTAGMKLGKFEKAADER
ncbi:hypothetical protein [Bacteroides xylanisolvens]|uniref:hypothetical protein n=1 Tax=Bacteroides xylanisolvens TaxID=371601 RepID=UPI0039B5BBB0